MSSSRGRVRCSMCSVYLYTTGSRAMPGDSSDRSAFRGGMFSAWSMTYSCLTPRALPADGGTPERARDPARGSTMSQGGGQWRGEGNAVSDCP